MTVPPVLPRTSHTRPPSSSVGDLRPLRALYGPGSARRVIAVAAGLYLVIFLARVADHHPADGVELFYMLPVTLLALRFGVRGGLLAAATATALYWGWSIIDNDGLSAAEAVSRPLIVFIVGGALGYLTTATVSALMRYDVALKAAPVLVFTTDTDLRYTWTHNTWAGRVDMPMLGLTDLELLGEEAGRVPQALKQRAFDSGETVHETYDVLDPDGVRRWFSVTIEPTRDNGGRITGLTGAALDVTPEMEAREALERSEHRFRAAAENQLEPFALYAAVRAEGGEIVEFRNEFINGPGAESVGMSREEMVGKSLSELFPGRLESGLMDEYATVVETGVPLFREAIDYLDVLGSKELVRAFDIRVSKLDDGIQITWRDITDKVRAERERDWLVAMVENTDDAIMSVDVEGKIVSWSASAERLYGYSSAEIVGRPLYVLVPDDAIPTRRELLRKVVAGERIGPIEAVEKCKDGSLIGVTFAATPIRDRDGNVVGAARVMRESAVQASAHDEAAEAQAE